MKGGYIHAGVHNVFHLFKHCLSMSVIAHIHVADRERWLRDCFINKNYT